MSRWEIPISAWGFPLLVVASIVGWWEYAFLALIIPTSMTLATSSWNQWEMGYGLPHLVVYALNLQALITAILMLTGIINIRAWTAFVPWIVILLGTMAALAFIGYTLVVFRSYTSVVEYHTLHPTFLPGGTRWALKWPAIVSFGAPGVVIAIIGYSLVWVQAIPVGGAFGASGTLLGIPIVLALVLGR